MNRTLALFAIPLGLAAAAAAARADEIPSWAYPLNPPGAQPAKDDGSLIHVPDSTVAMTRKQITARDGVPDWHPEDHPAMPAIVAKGADKVRACAYCHQPTGVGRPENAALTGLTPNYIKEQVAAFKAGERHGSEPKRLPENLMIGIAKNVSDADVAAAAAYFSVLKPVSLVKVVEADRVPATFVTGGMLAKSPGGGMEAIGARIIEVPDDVERAENRDSRTPFTAYVPRGSLAKGEAIVATGGGKTIACSVCHGADLKGAGDVPLIAGRSPSYLMRQLYDIKHGTRSGPSVALMKQVVAGMSDDDMIAVAAYVASRKP
jgi:cytochrome c553